MKYYKLINNNEFVCVASSDDFVYYNHTTQCFLTSNETFGHFVTNNGKLYRDYWMAPLVDCNCPFTNVKITEITEEEFQTLLNAVITNQEIQPIIDNPPITIYPEPPEQQEEDPDAVLAFIKTSKINEMSAACRTIIENGFDLELHGKTYHFSLTTQDQLNLMSLGTLAQTQTLIPYHADGEEYEFYTANEINEIIAAANSLKNYNTAYYNSLKGYINSLETIEEISAITYGTTIPEEYKSDVLKVLEY